MDSFPPTSLLRHVSACNNAVLPGERIRLCVGPHHVGWLRPDLAAEIQAFPGVTGQDGSVAIERPEDLPEIARIFADRGLLRWRAEAFDVRADLDGPSLTTIDRGALPDFGIMAQGVHLNGLVRRDGALWLWVGRRAVGRALDPGKLDHLVAGGVPAGLTPQETLVKEAGEEAAIPPDMARQAVACGRISYAMERPEGLRRDVLHCFDLWVPDEFMPRADDGEAEGFELWPMARVIQTVRETDDFKFNVNLVLIDLFCRHSLIPPAEAQALRSALDEPRRL